MQLTGLLIFIVFDYHSSFRQAPSTKVDFNASRRPPLVDNRCVNDHDFLHGAVPKYHGLPRVEDLFDLLKTRGL